MKRNEKIILTRLSPRNSWGMGGDEKGAKGRLGGGKSAGLTGVLETFLGVSGDLVR